MGKRDDQHVCPLLRQFQDCSFPELSPMLGVGGWGALSGDAAAFEPYRLLVSNPSLILLLVTSRTTQWFTELGFGELVWSVVGSLSGESRCAC